MKKLNRVTLIGAIICAAAWSVPAGVQAQWSAGVSYGTSGETPKNGVGVRAERSLMGVLPAVDLRLRGHFSYFGVVEGSNNFAVYDYGIGMLAAIPAGPLTPYAGLGIGAVNYNLPRPDALTGETTGGSSTYFGFSWGGFVGAELNSIPVITPFTEYRLHKTEKSSRTGISEHLTFGLSVAF